MPMHPVTPEVANAWLSKGQAMLVDVREPAEHRARHIPPAFLIPLSDIQSADLPADGRKIVVHCEKGARGGSACERLAALYPNLEIYNMSGGIEAWAKSGLPVTHGDRNALPLDRQVQLTVGLLLLLTTALSLTVAPAFVLLAGFLGLGLTLAGITGFCGLALILARMPWNR